MTTTDESMLRVFERKDKICGLLRIDNGEYRSRWNEELYEIYDICMVERIKRHRLWWLGHAVRMYKNISGLGVFDAVPPGGSRGRGRLPLYWKDQVEKDLATLGISNWRQTVKRKNGYRVVVTK